MLLRARPEELGVSAEQLAEIAIASADTAEHAKKAVACMFIGVVPALLLTGTTLNIQSIMGLVMLICRGGFLTSLRRRLAAVGRMALTNYLMHSLICLFLFTGTGFALVGELERWALYPIVFAIWSLAVGMSDAFLKPLLMGRGVDVPMLVIFIGAIGGFVLSGIIGLFVGAIVFALGYKLFVLWLEENA